MDEQKKQNASGDKLYPRRCCECGKIAVHPAKIAYTAKIKYDGKLHEFHIAELPVDQCQECKEEFFTNATSDAKSDALRRHLSHPSPPHRLRRLGGEGR